MLDSQAPISDTISATVTDRLRALVLSGELPPETHLREKELCERFGVSRTPVRDALLVLAKEGLLVFAPYRGYVTREFKLSDVLNTYELRSILEGAACRITADGGLSRDARTAMADAIDESERLLALSEWGDVERARWCALNGIVHATIVDGARNPQLAAAIDRTRALPVVYSDRVTWFVNEQILRLFDDDAKRRSLDEHRRIFEAIVAHDGRAAETVMHGHIMAAADILRRNWNTALASAVTRTDATAPAADAASAGSVVATLVGDGRSSTRGARAPASAKRSVPGGSGRASGAPGEIKRRTR